MRIDTFRVIAFISAAILLVVVVFAFFASPHIGSAYLRTLKNLGNDLPLLTKDFSLPLLGNENNPFSTFPERSVWSWCLWLIFICWPIALLIWVLRVPDFEQITGSMVSERDCIPFFNRRRGLDRNSRTASAVYKFVTSNKAH